MRTGRPARLESFDYRGSYRYFLTFCTFHRRRVFVTGEPVALVLTQFRRAAVREQFALPAYCFMPDHVHLLVEGQDARSDARRFINLAKQLSGYYFRRLRNDRLWQRYSFEQTLRRDQHSLEVARYILENPVRARLVEQVTEYPFLGSDVHAIEHILEAAGDARRGSRSGQGSG